MSMDEYRKLKATDDLVSCRVQVMLIDCQSPFKFE